MVKEMPAEKWEEFVSFMQNICENSLVTGLPEIISAKRISVKLMRLLIFSLCMFGFVYQSLEFMNLYWAYSTVLDIQITRPLETDMPAFSVCDINGILRTKYCKYHQCSVPADITDFCGCYTASCKDGRLLPGILIRTSEEEFHNVSYLPQPQRLKYMIRPTEFILSCKVRRIDSDETKECGEATLNPSSPSASIQASVCYNIHSFHKRPHQKPKTIPTTTVIDLELFLKPEDYDHYLIDMQKQIAVYYPYRLTNPFVEGHYLAAGRKYKLYVKETVKTLLKPPYDTNCYDYMTEWNARGGEGPVSEVECIEHCKLEKYHKSQPCIPYILWYPHNYARCPQFCKVEFCASFHTFVPNITKFTEECAAQCKPACKQVSYDIVKEEVPSSGEIRRGKSITNLDGHSFATISYEKYEKTVYIYSPKYDVIETFSYIGGYIGIWLGISLIAVFDFLETLLVLVRYLFRKKNNLVMLEKQHV